MWTDAHRLKVIKVGADWCAPCKKVSPCFAKLASSLNNVDCFTVDVTDKTDVDGVWSVFKAVGGVKLPYFALYKDHQRVEGVQTSDIDVVKGLVQKHLAADKTEAPFVEPLLKDDIDRFVLFPLKNKPLWDMYKKHESTFWTAEELDLEQDRRDFDQKLNDNERYFIKHVLAFFAASDAIVNENLVQNFMDEVQSAEARCFYGFQIMIENIHSETYSLLIDNLIGDKEEKKHLFNAIKTVPIIKKKAEWCFRWTDRSQASFAERLVAFACVEGIFFSGSFCAVFWLKKRGILPGVTFSNQLISRDEGLHCDFACLLYSQLERKLDQDRVHQIVDSAVQMECEFVSSALPVSLIGMNAKLMCQYIRFCADRLIEALGYDKKYKTTNPFEWMTIISLQNKGNFFETRISEYAKAGVGVDDDEGFTLDADF
jgi:ribonucleotide reductase beta subunit family protein with ferritin-like domain